MPRIQDTSATDRAIVRRGPKWSTLVLAVAAVLVLVGLALSYPALKRWSSAERSFERDLLRFAGVTRGTFVRDLAVEGRVVASSYPTLYSPAQGTVRLEVRAGDEVQKGQLLARVDSPEIASQLPQEISLFEATEAELSGQRVTNRTTNLQNRQDVDLKRLRKETAEREMQRMRQARSEGLINQIEYAEAEDSLGIAELEYEHAVESARLQTETMDHSLRTTEKQLERQRLVLVEAQRRVRELEVLSPVDGVVGNIAVNPSDIVIPNQELLTVIDLSAFEIEIQIPETYADDIEIGATAEITYEGAKHRGRVSSVSPEVTGSLVEGRVAFHETPPQGLKQNRRVSTRILLSSKDNALMVRRGPFLEAGGGRKVYVVDGNLARLAIVTIGGTSLTEIEILSGLEEGDTIVISDTARFQDADTVLLR